ncbi:hypothetical protein Ae168Ps1_0694 [Pseudonocardia sp. Ae168_Ps1]|nr:hypothetical protein Ae150APs1_0695 [Pseudonocardia sp. Ae150A_Ps1]OLL78288.1 hypothetical protein Ae168Ps1_0694 [Pseudonocardia sp. Ae168_Ps1]OLL87585.1 hypothetical protein Ae263Ps1_4640c [Pseudonocardia sp. Ae263_Ps1]OLL92384.1 hypothetical protein Ae356Ps1_2281 [Pseudonocardia sp. Ae356_Ps1]
MFSEEGRSLNNDFCAYRAAVTAADGDLDLIAIGVLGDEDIVRSMTRSLSLYSG